MKSWACGKSKGGRQAIWVKAGRPNGHEGAAEEGGRRKKYPLIVRGREQEGWKDPDRKGRISSPLPKKKGFLSQLRRGRGSYRAYSKL